RAGSRLAAGIERDLVDCGANRASITFGGLDGASEQLGGELVVPLGHADREFAEGAPVHLRGASGTGPTAARGPLVVGVKEAVLDEPVEVELRNMEGHADAGCGLLAGDWPGAAGDGGGQGGTGRVPERRDPVQAGAGE